MKAASIMSNCRSLADQPQGRRDWETFVLEMRPPELQSGEVGRNRR